MHPSVLAEGVCQLLNLCLTFIVALVATQRDKIDVPGDSSWGGCVCSILDNGI